jgi:L-iditol 2-dehydrogenase
MQGVVKLATGPGNMELREVPDPTPGPGEVLIRVEAAGVCGTDLHIYQGEYPVAPPVVIGHEFCGTIAGLGAGVEGLAPGRPVTAETTARNCGRCQPCRSGSYQLCPERKGIGSHLPGAFAQAVVVPAARVHPLPDAVGFRAGALCEPLACAVHGVSEVTGVRAGDLVLVTGPGPIGLLVAQVARAEGGRVVLVGTERDAVRLDLARGLGFAEVLTAGRDDVAGRVAALSDGRGADIVLECSGAAAGAHLCLELAARQGKFTQIGLFGKPIQLDFERIVFKELRVAGTFGQKWSAWRRALDLLAAGQVRTEPLVTHAFPLAAWREAFRTAEEARGAKVLLLPQE